ncbi:type II secretion system minor pseudopilin GspK [Psychromonas aquatilis]|uniref:Type II secretion system protein K n=1 Tax=Psychromonas aquatilis TaxID=2005072 RepID=A0ABU9GPB6_9GAMM
MNNSRKQAGIALITVLMILAIMVTVATTMTGRMTSSLLRTEGLNYSQKMYWYTQAMVDFSQLIINNDFADSDVVSLDQIWATPDLIFPVDEGSILGHMIDKRSCFNLNALASESNEELGVSQLKALLTAMDVEEYSADVISESVRDWVDSDDAANDSQGAEDRYYESLNVPHLTANKLMVDISELRSIQGMTAEIYLHIKDRLCALPATDQLINVNTVKADQAEVLFALFTSDTSITLDQLESLLEERPTSGWISVAEFLESDIFSNETIPDTVQAQLSVTSDFFQMNGIAEFEERAMALKLLLKVESKVATTIRFQYAAIEEVDNSETISE